MKRINWHTVCNGALVKFRILKPALTSEQQAEAMRQRTRERMRQNEALQRKINAKKDLLEEILKNVSFENKSKFELSVSVTSSNVFLYVKRKLYCSETHQMRYIHNHKGLGLDCTPEDFVKGLFVACGQFESHEFCESFQLYGRNAYFPHDSSVPNYFGGGNRINRLILSPWRDITESRTDLQIARRFFVYWLADTRPVRGLVWIDSKITQSIESCIKLGRLVLVTAISVPSYVRAVLMAGQPVEQNSIDSQNSSKEGAA